MNSEKPHSIAQILRWSLVMVMCGYGMKQALSASAASQPTQAQPQILLPQITPSLQEPNRDSLEEFVVWNTTPAFINVRFEANGNRGITEPIAAGESRTIRRTPLTTTVYSFQGSEPIALTQDMIINGMVTIRMPEQVLQQPMPMQQPMQPAPIPPVQASPPAQAVGPA